MSWATLGSAVLHEARVVLNNRKLRVVRCPDIGVNVAVLAAMDKRKPS